MKSRRHVQYQENLDMSKKILNRFCDFGKVPMSTKFFLGLNLNLRWRTIIQNYRIRRVIFEAVQEKIRHATNQTSVS